MFFTLISIPYGAIKSLLYLYIVVLLEKISIPYGAIKSKTDYKELIKINIFQFLMVRLKVFYHNI